MKITSRHTSGSSRYWIGSWLVLGSMTACGDDSGTTPGTGTESDTEDTGNNEESTSDDPDSTGQDPDTTGTDPDTSTGQDPDTTTDQPESSSSDGGPDGPPAEFFVRIENVSNTGVLPATISPGLWVEQAPGTTPVFVYNTPDGGDGLVALAEDGDPATLATSVMAIPAVEQSGTWADPLAPGEMVEFNVTAQNGNWLSLYAGFGGANDGFLATGPVGVGLFDAQGMPEEERDITSLFRLWDVGSEYNQAPGQGPHQQATQPADDTGMNESGQVVPFASSTRALPQAGGIVDVEVTTDLLMPGVLTITITNAAENDRGTVASQLSPLLWALHEDTFELFGAGVNGADVVGLEALAEDGDPAPWFAAIDGTVGVGMAATIDTPADPEESFAIVVTPDQDNRFLSIATSIAATNDAFMAPLPGGIALLEEDGSARSNDDIEDDFRRMFLVWDAGTEANEVPGVGSNIQSEQVLPDSGPDDANAVLRPYSDGTNDLSGADVGGFLTVTIVNGVNAGDFDVTIENTSGATVYPGALSPVLYAVHDDTVTLFDENMAASPSLESLAEDGDATALFGDVDGGAGVSDAAVGPSPLGEGDDFQFTVTADEATPFLSIASMVVPSNDTFIAFGPAGIRLVDDNGVALTDQELAAAVAAELSAWEAGTEANQAGAIGRDQAPRQAADNTGVNEGNGLVRFTEDDPVWFWPEADQLIRVTIGPTGN